MIFIIRCNNIVSDSRVLKYVHFYKTNNLSYKIIAWDRLNDQKQLNDTIYFKDKVNFNQGGFKAVWFRLKWMRFVYEQLCANRKDIDIIHACDLDTVFPAVIFKYIKKKHIKVIFDVFDWFSATLYNQGTCVLFAFKLMEWISIKGSDEVIICEPERIKQIPYKLNKKEIVLPNIPSFDDDCFLCANSEYKFLNKKITLVYVGGFTNCRCLDLLLDLAEQDIVNVSIAGFGVKHIEDRCIKLKDRDNFKYFGKVDYKTGLNIMWNADILYAMYSKINPNHYYAAPNKYYEAMMLGKPLISTKGINLEEKIVKNDIGFIVEESFDHLLELINNISETEFLEKGKKAKSLWDVKYKTYTFDFLKNDYQQILSV